MSQLKSNRRARHAVREHLPGWMLNLATEADEVLAAAPYVTEGRLFKKCEPNVARLYTAFTAINFISGGSRLSVLKGLLNSGVAIYHVNHLHAKVVMIDGEHFSLGSQNLTVRGRSRNVEASFVAGSDTPSKEVRAFFERIHKNARSISIQDIFDMEKVIGPWIKRFKEIVRVADRIDQDLGEKRERRETKRKRMLAVRESKLRKQEEQARREVEEQAKREAERLSAQNRSEMMKRAVLQNNKFFNRTPVNPKAQLVASVKKLTNPSKNLFSPDSHTNSLVPVDRKRDFSQLLKAIGVTPMMKYRYLVFDRDTGKLGFARINKTQWTYFGNRVLPAEKITKGGFSFDVEIRFNWSYEKNLTNNGTAIFRFKEINGLKGHQIASIDFAFSVIGVELGVLVIEPSYKHLSLIGQLAAQTFKNEMPLAEVKGYLVRHLTKPFKFTRNLFGSQASEFFVERHPKTYTIEAHRFEQTAIFSVRQSGLAPRT